MTGIRTTNFDAVAASSPLDRQASVIRDGSGDLYDKPLAGVRVERWLAPPPLKPLSDHSAPGRVLVQAFMGTRLGRVTVLGIWAGTNPRKNSVWVCRCDCGYYEGLKMKSLNRLGDAAACSHCQQTDRLRAMASAPSTGSSRNASGKRLDRMAVGSR